MIFERSGSINLFLISKYEAVKYLRQGSISLLGNEASRYHIFPLTLCTFGYKVLHKEKIQERMKEQTKGASQHPCEVGKYC